MNDVNTFIKPEAIIVEFGNVDIITDSELDSFGQSDIP